MSGRYVRMSKFRHVFGEASKTEGSYSDVKALTAGDGNFIKCNPEYFAYAKPGGGGPLIIHKLGEYGRMDINHPVINVHKSQIQDFDFSPFNNHIIATASDDCTIAVTRFPEEGLHENIQEADAILEGHTKKLALIHWHPTAENVLGSVAYDRDMKIWDVEAQEDLVTFEGHEDNVFSFEWSEDGANILTTSRDRMVRMFDPRQDGPVIETESHEGQKTSRCFWVPDQNLFGSVGFSRTSQRKIMFWDPRKPDDWIHKTDLDQAASVLCPFYDADTSVLFLAGKGDGTIRYFEITDQAGFCHFLSDYRNNTPQKGVACMPKRAMEVGKAEIAHFLRLTRDTVQPVSMQCPRKNAANVFQEDIFPDCYAGVPSADANAYFSGVDAPPKKVSLAGKISTGGRGKTGRSTRRKQVSTLRHAKPSSSPASSPAPPSASRAEGRVRGRGPPRSGDSTGASAGASAGSHVTSEEKFEEFEKELEQQKKTIKKQQKKVAELNAEVEDCTEIIQLQATKIKLLTEQLAKLM